MIIIQDQLQSKMLMVTTVRRMVLDGNTMMVPAAMMDGLMTVMQLFDAQIVTSFQPTQNAFLVVTLSKLPLPALLPLTVVTVFLLGLTTSTPQILAAMARKSTSWMGKTTVYFSPPVETGMWVTVAVKEVVVDMFGLLLGLAVFIALDSVGQLVVVLVLMQI